MKRKYNWHDQDYFKKFGVCLFWILCSNWCTFQISLVSRDHLTKRVVKLTGVTCTRSGQVTVTLRPYAHPTSGSGKRDNVQLPISVLKLSRLKYQFLICYDFKHSFTKFVLNLLFGPNWAFIVIFKQTICIYM